jgi:hypothetical protein
VPDLIPALRVGDREVHFGARPARQWTTKAPLAATTIRLEYWFIIWAIQAESEVANRARITQGAYFRIGGDIVDIRFWAVKATTSHGTRTLNMEGVFIGAIFRVEDVEVPWGAIWGALLQLPSATIRLLNSVEYLVLPTIGKDFVLVCHLNLLPNDGT